MTQRKKRDKSWPKLPAVCEGKDPSPQEQERILAEIAAIKSEPRAIVHCGPLESRRNYQKQAPTVWSGVSAIRVCHDPRPYSRR